MKKTIFIVGVICFIVGAGLMAVFDAITDKDPVEDSVETVDTLVIEDVDTLAVDTLALDTLVVDSIAQ